MNTRIVSSMCKYYLLFIVFGLAHANFFGDIPGKFNTFVFGDFRCNASETQGFLAVGGNLRVASYGIACTPIVKGKIKKPLPFNLNNYKGTV